ncbi:hypothetical protein C8Q77DRAFT_1146640 [Trametes polyzona]|nr:hypothetical protein C8Q77DRAFT_1146640 [Trametes polyzona]
MGYGRQWPIPSRAAVGGGQWDMRGLQDRWPLRGPGVRRQAIAVAVDPTASRPPMSVMRHPRRVVSMDEWGQPEESSRVSSFPGGSAPDVIEAPSQSSARLLDNTSSPLSCAFGRWPRELHEIVSRPRSSPSQQTLESAAGLIADTQYKSGSSMRACQCGRLQNARLCGRRI